jgi:hypothetical protein
MNNYDKINQRYIKDITNQFNEIFGIDSDKTFETITENIEAGSLPSDKTFEDKFIRYIKNGCELIYNDDIREFLIKKDILVRLNEKDTKNTERFLLDIYCDYMYCIYKNYKDILIK